MKNFLSLSLALAAMSSAFFASSCGVLQENMEPKTEADTWTFGKDLDFLKKQADCIVIGESESFVAISPKLQGRVMTSTLEGAEGYSIGWINRKLLEDQKEESYLNNFGGEDRLWFGPEATDFSLFFQKNALSIGENWKIPYDIQSAWEVSAQTQKQVRIEKNMNLTNAQGFKFTLRALREISYISKADAAQILGIEIPDSVKSVAFQSFNKVINKGDKKWEEASGLISMNIFSCFHANKATYGFVPYNEGEHLGNIITDSYNEPVGTDRLSIYPNFVRMRLDGIKLAEINVNPKRSKGIFGAYDSDRNILTIVSYIRPGGLKKYMPANWRKTNNILDGDALSMFNNGSPKEGYFEADRFYETSTHSPALALEPEAAQIHIQRVFHFKGSEYELGAIAYKLLGVSIKNLRPE